MNINSIFTLGLGIVAAGVIMASFAAYGKRRKREAFYNLQIEEKNISRSESVLFDDVISWFKQHNMKKGKDTAFIASSECFSKEQIEKLSVKDSEKVVMWGIYKDGDENLADYMFLISAGFEQKILDILGQEKVVVLD